MDTFLPSNVYINKKKYFFLQNYLRNQKKSCNFARFFDECVSHMRKIAFYIFRGLGSYKCLFV